MYFRFQILGKKRWQRFRVIPVKEKQKRITESQQENVQKSNNETSCTSTDPYSHELTGTSTEGYGVDKSVLCGDAELMEVLDTFSKLSDQMIEEISTEYSMDEYIDVLQKSDEDKENIKGKNAMDRLKKIVSFQGEEKLQSDNEEERDHDIETCSCHITIHLQYAVDLIQLKDKMIPLIEKM